MSYEDLNKQLEPFKLMVFDEGTEDVWATLVLWLNEDYKQNVFDTRQEDGFLGNGYDWNSLATVFLEEKMPELVDALSFDSEAGLFSIGSEDVDPIVMNGISTGTSNHDFFSQVGNGYLLGSVEAMDDEDYTKWL